MLEKPINTVEQSMGLAERVKSFSQENLINVATQNNFCGYYVLARRIINDVNFSAELIEKFNQFYATRWNAKQVAEVVSHMHPRQADVLLGLVLYDQRKLGGEGKGLYFEDLKQICLDFAYNLFLYECDNIVSFPNNIRNSVQLPDAPLSNHNKEIIVLFEGKIDCLIGHYYLVEPDVMKVAAVEFSSGDDYPYFINNEGSDIPTFIDNIKQSVVKIERLITGQSAINVHSSENLSEPIQIVGRSVEIKAAEDDRNLVTITEASGSHNNEGSFDTLTIDNIKQSVVEIDRLNIALVNACSAENVFERTQTEGRSVEIKTVAEDDWTLVTITEASDLQVQQDKRIDDEYIAWTFAVEEAEQFSGKSFVHLKNLLKYSFFSDTHVSQQVNEAKGHVHKIQAEAIKFFASKMGGKI